MRYLYNDRRIGSKINKISAPAQFHHHHQHHQLHPLLKSVISGINQERVSLANHDTKGGGRGGRMGDTRNVVVIPWRERAGGGGELTSRNVAARIGSKVETRVRLDCHPESILITATSQPLFLRRCTTGLFLLDRERERERNSPLSN